MIFATDGRSTCAVKSVSRVGRVVSTRFPELQGRSSFQPPLRTYSRPAYVSLALAERVRRTGHARTRETGHVTRFGVPCVPPDVICGASDGLRSLVCDLPFTWP